MSYFVVLYFPERESAKGLPFGLRGSRLFNYQIDRGQPASKSSGKVSPADRVEIETVAVNKGANWIDGKAWDSVNSHEVNKTVITKLLQTGALKIFAPDTPETAVKDSTDFCDIGVIQEIAGNTKDVDWLSLSQMVERRPEVRTLLAQRLQEIQEEVAAMSQKLNGAIASPGMR